MAFPLSRKNPLLSLPVSHETLTRLRRFREAKAEDLGMGEAMEDIVFVFVDPPSEQRVAA